MTAIRSPHLDQFCTTAAWRLEAQKNNLSRYSLESALRDLTGVGAIYNLGADAAVSSRLEREKQWFKRSLPAANDEVAQQSKDVNILWSKLVCGIDEIQAEDQASLRTTQLNRVAYLASIITYLAASVYDAYSTPSKLASAPSGSPFDTFPLRLIGGCGAVASGAFMLSRAAYGSMDTYPAERALDLQNTAMQMKDAARKS